MAIGLIRRGRTYTLLIHSVTKLHIVVTNNAITYNDQLTKEEIKRVKQLHNEGRAL